MALLQISFSHKLNASLQINDIAWVCDVGLNNIQSGQLDKLGVINDIQGNVLTVDADDGVTCIPGMFFLFSKPIQVNESGLKGYYADVTFKNASKTYAELFTISSEIVPSSK